MDSVHLKHVRLHEILVAQFLVTDGAVTACAAAASSTATTSAGCRAGTALIIRAVASRVVIITSREIQHGSTELIRHHDAVIVLQMHLEEVRSEKILVSAQLTERVAYGRVVSFRLIRWIDFDDTSAAAYA